MKESKPLDTNTTKKKKNRWSLSMDSNGINQSIEVRELDGPGYMIRVNKYGRPNDKPNSNYVDESKEYYSEINPIETKVKPEQDVQDDIENLFDPFASLFK
jgi:hypothetical protein